ncbi:MAG: hypothetical protein HY901_05145 [Deltaproteobacteria bacterium]|nr:hypothetical protein [Deltaproteobacteria bacterium]
MNSSADLIFPADYQGAALASEDGSVGRRGLVTSLLEEMLESGPRPRAVYGAGPERMLLAVQELVTRFEVPFQLSFERYMKCGFGLCGQCALDGSGVQVCTEGPVLERQDLEGVTDLGQPHRTASGRRPATSQKT